MSILVSSEFSLVLMISLTYVSNITTPQRKIKHCFFVVENKYGIHRDNYIIHMYNVATQLCCLGIELLKLSLRQRYIYLEQQSGGSIPVCGYCSVIDPVSV